MNALAPTPLTWPPTHTSNRDRRWAHQALADLAAEADASWHAHQHLTRLARRLDRADPPQRGALAAALSQAATAAVPRHDTNQLIDTLANHGHPAVADTWRRAARHRIDTLDVLRNLADADQLNLLDPNHARRRLDPALADLAALGAALTHTDHALIAALTSTNPRR